MTEPLPNCFSIWPSAAASAFLRLSSIAKSPLENERLGEREPTKASCINPQEMWCKRLNIPLPLRRLYRELSASSGHSATALYTEPDSPFSLRINAKRSQCIDTGEASKCGHSHAAA